MLEITETGNATLFKVILKKNHALDFKALENFVLLGWIKKFDCFVQISLRQ